MWSSEGTAENLASLLSSGQCDQSSYILTDTSLKWIRESSFALPRMWYKRSFNGEQFRKKFGFACCLELSSNNCNWSSSLYSSKRIEKKDTPGQNHFDINIRTIIAFREMGKGHSGLETFYAIMNMPPLMNIKAFNNMHPKVSNTYINI